MLQGVDFVCLFVASGAPRADNRAPGSLVFGEKIRKRKEWKEARWEQIRGSAITSKSFRMIIFLAGPSCLIPPNLEEDSLRAGQRKEQVLLLLLPTGSAGAAWCK